MVEAWHRCCVCGHSIRPGHELYANTYEEIARRHALCSDACQRAWDPDRHWLPSLPPASLTPSDQARLLHQAIARARQGDSLSALVRELLVCGVETSAVEVLLREARIDDHLWRRRERQLHANFLVAALISRKLGLLLGSLWRVLRPPAVRPASEAQAMLDAWRAYFSITSNETRPMS